MILVDTSVWIDHLRAGEPLLIEALEAGQVLMHPFVIGEVACRRVKRRTEVLALMCNLPQAAKASEAEALEFIERRGLMERGIGYIDVHLLASVALAGGGARLWTRDRQLAAVARDFGFEFAGN